LKGGLGNLPKESIIEEEEKNEPDSTLPKSNFFLLKIIFFRKGFQKQP